MLSPADSEVVRRDPAVPALATLLDVDAFGQVLRDQSDAPEFDAIEAVYVRYKPGTNCLAGYRLHSGDSHAFVHAKTFHAEETHKLEKARRFDGSAEPCSGATHVIDSLRMVIRRFPADPELPILSRLESPERGRLLARVLRRFDSEVEGRLTPLAYKPQRRFVARLDLDDEPPLVIRFYASLARFRSAQAARALAPGELLRLPERRGKSKRHLALAYEWLPGASLRELLDSPAGDDAPFESIGRALAELHAQPAELSRSRERDRIAELRELVGTLDVLLPDAADQTRRILSQLTAALAGPGRTTGPIHGDLHEKQILVGGDGIGLCDLDDARMGDLHEDLGLFFAHLERGNLSSGRSRARTDAAMEGVLTGYRSRLPADRGALAPHIAAGLLSLAHHPFRNRQPDWPTGTHELLDRTEALLQAG